MNLIRVFLKWLGLLIIVGLVILAIVVSYDGACDDSEPGSNGASMQAVTYSCYGSPDVLKVNNIDMPQIKGGEVLVKVKAASVNPLDWHYMRGEPYLMRLSTGFGNPKRTQFGVDFAGVVESVGDQVTEFEVGDSVYGGASGAFAEYLRIAEELAIVRAPDNISIAQAAGVPIAGISALQALRDKGRLQAGQTVLINGASGGVGTFAIQIAKAMGAEVTAVCSERNRAMVKRLGADFVVNYKQQNFTELGKRYDLIIDNIGNHSPSRLRQVVKENGRVVMVGGESGKWLGPMIGPIKAVLLNPFVSQEFIPFLASMNKKDLAALAEMMKAGSVQPVIDRRYKLHEVAEAIAYSESGRARGKIILELE